MTPDLLRVLNQKYKISAKALKPFGPVWQVDSVKGRFVLKSAEDSVKRLICTAETLFQLKKSGFHSLILPEISSENLPYFQYNNHYYQLFQWRQGYHPSFTDPGLIQKCSSLLARLHRISAIINQRKNHETPDIIANLEQRTAFLEEIIISLKRQRRLNRIDRTILKWSDYYLAQAGYSLAGLHNTAQSLDLINLVGFCHNDPASRNIIIQNGEFFLIDFQLSAWGLSITEVAKLAGRVLQANDWRPEIFNLVVDAYSRERPLTEWERSVLPYLLCFPSHFWRICSQRWEEKLKWSERRFAARLWKITAAERQRLLFLKSRLPGLPIPELTNPRIYAN